MRELLIVAAGGALGSVARYAVATLAFRSASAWPLGTFAVNAIGCLLVGAVAGLALGRPPAVSPAWRLFLVVGVCGGFTTFSAFGLETVELLRAGHTAIALANAAGQVLAGLLAVWAGLALVRAI